MSERVFRCILCGAELRPRPAPSADFPVLSRGHDYVLVLVPSRPGWCVMCGADPLPGDEVLHE